MSANQSFSTLKRKDLSYIFVRIINVYCFLTKFMIFEV